jgi:glutaconyl-CoA decarboxylase
VVASVTLVGSLCRPEAIVKREITLRIGNDEVTFVASRSGQRIVIEHDGHTYDVELVSDKTIGSADAIQASTAARPERAAPSPAAASPPKTGGVAGVAGSGLQTGTATVPTGSAHIAAQMAGVVREVLIQPGNRVRAGEKIVVLEAMKMEIDVYSPADGTVEDVLVSVGQNVVGGEPLALLGATSGEA